VQGTGFQDAWKAADATGQRPRIEDYLVGLSEADQPVVFRQLLSLELAHFRQASPGNPPSQEEYQRRFPHLEDVVAAVFREAPAPSPQKEPPSNGSSLKHAERSPAETADTPLPERFGRYRVTQLLGSGGFGVVYRGFDEDLRREVAIKVPLPGRLTAPGAAEAYLAEGRMLAGLDHAGIVPVYDVGRTAEGTCYLVSKFVPGSDLRSRLKEGTFTLDKAVDIIAAAAEALHYAHQHGLVHRDIKPANILLDPEDRPVLVDFGLALREGEVAGGNTFAGTPAYMSPEQARNEGHRVDPRTDVYSLGVILYEMLTGQRPFQAATSTALLEQIKIQEPRPPRQLSDQVPKDLDRICLKALAKRAADRYSTALDLAEDLRAWQAEAGDRPAGKGSTILPVPGAPNGPLATPSGSGAHPTPSRSRNSRSGELAVTEADTQPARVVPRGLRAFDIEDADFFPELLPGPRDRHGLPESLRFWKTRIEATEPERAFSIGLLYGPSGCGKSSLVKAGLLPRLAPEVVTVYVEATPTDTEIRLLNALRRRLPRLPDHFGLVEALAALRRRQGQPPHAKVLLVLDQFEQWLHGARGEPDALLVQALRQCDGQHLQCLILVRDDFAMAVARFMHDLEIPIVEGRNFAAVDLFDLGHARKILTQFGQAFGCLPADTAELPREQARFLDEAVTGLAQDGRVIPVRLALFVEMIKSRPWTPATLHRVGGLEGLGLSFLEETFSSRNANPEYRVHQNGVRAVLHALLPEAGTDLKGHQRSHQELLQAAGYAARPREFEGLIRILDTELRLITPTDPEEKDEGGRMKDEKKAGESDNSSFILPPSSLRCYQLTHDYLVPILRQWLTRRQQATYRGRAELRLASRAALWNARPESRQLPTWWEWLTIVLFTGSQTWSPTQQQMMRAASRRHLSRLAAVLVLVGLLGWGTWTGVAYLKASLLVHNLVTADAQEVPAIIHDLDPYRNWADPALRELVAGSEPDARARLRASLALLPVEPGHEDFLAERLLTASPSEALVIRAALRDHRPERLRRLWDDLEDPRAVPARRLRAAFGLAALEPVDAADARWQPLAAALVDQALAEAIAKPGEYLALTEALQPLQQVLIPALENVLSDAGRPDSQRRAAANWLAEYVTEPEALVACFLEADVHQAGILLAKLQGQRDRALPLLHRELEKPWLPEAPEKAKEDLARRQAKAAAALLAFGTGDVVWPLFRYHPPGDPRRRSYLIHSAGLLGVDPKILIRRLAEESDTSARRALVLSLGQFAEHQFSPESRRNVIAHLLATYRNDPDGGLHAAAEWLLRRWGQAAAVEAADRQLISRRPLDARQWYVNRHQHTFVVLKGPVEFDMGSAPQDPDAEGSNEQQHRRRIPHAFALATKEVTVRQFQRFLDDNARLSKMALQHSRHYSPDPDRPVIGVTLFEAAMYCNWLSQQDGIPPEQWCYPPLPQFRQALEDAARETKPDRVQVPLFPNFQSRTGYRLPTEAEWEYAARANAATSRFYGSTEELLDQYAWYARNARNQPQPVGLLKPNDFGLFDMYGNAEEWVNSPACAYPVQVGEDVADDGDFPRVMRGDAFWVLRGGSFFQPGMCLRSAFRTRNPAYSRDAIQGFRVARTCP
jgi:serine/threonine protein kinase/formylglycine-generating enzyme required for sulfatase activity